MYYDHEFKPIKLSIELIIIRHGETYGNCGQSTIEGEIDYELVNLGIKNREKRIYQGDVNKEINQLTQLGKQQALEASYTIRGKIFGTRMGARFNSL